MRNFSTWLLVFFMILFWGFRVIVAFTSEIGGNFGGIVPFNNQFEIILLFVVLIAVIFVVKRNIIGPLIYLVGYGMYFGTNVVSGLTNVFSVEAGATLNLSVYINTIISLIGVILPIAVLLDLLLEKARMKNPSDKKTDWFYDNKDFDRKLDDRADKNKYRTM